jgi:TonB family protein
MKYVLTLLVGLALAACTTPPSHPSSAFRPDVLYYVNNAGGKQAADDVTKLFGGQQEVATIDGEIPDATYPIPVLQVRALYPFEMRQKNLEGLVNVEFIVGENGKVLDAVAVATTNPGFNEQAEIAVRHWTFKPAIRDGVPVRSLMRVEITFALPAKS